MQNPLLSSYELPPFAAFDPAQVEPALDVVLRDNRAAIESLLSDAAPKSFRALAERLEELDVRLNRAWSPVRHLNAVLSSDALRAAYNACLPKLTDYATELGQDERLYLAYKSLAESPEYPTLSLAQRKLIDNALRDFRLSGVSLPPAEKKRYKDISQRLSQLSAKFSDQVLDATDAWYKHYLDPLDLGGLPASALALARQDAERRGLAGLVVSLEMPSYLAVMTHANNRALRQEVYTAYSTRASDQGPNAGQWDNTPVIEEILALRHELAQLVGFESYAAYSLATKMAKNPDEVLSFLRDLAARAYPQAQREYEELQAFARQHGGPDTLEAWDVPYYSEKLRQHAYAISQEDLKPYFPAPRVVEGLFEIVRRLYGITIEEARGVELWHPDVRVFTVRDETGELRGQFYLDLFARPKKRGGAWMASALDRHSLGGQHQHPVAFLTCNFSPPVGSDPALLTHSEVTTLFHEFGHGLHHMLTRVDLPSLAGTQGVPWDAVELPSQFMENWCWEREALDLFASHYQTGEKLPDVLLQKLQAAKNFQSGMFSVRQLEFGIFDFRLHHEYKPAQGSRLLEILSEVRASVAVVKPPAWNRFPNAFSHIFAGGYAAGYYSYRWAEVLSADAFSAFEEEGIFNRATGKRFLETVLENGGTRDPLDLFVAFRGRPPRIDALLRHSGLS
jgi:oligopeptidase A